MSRKLTIAFAAGALVWERWHPRLRVLVRGTLVALLLCFGVLVLPPSLPVLPPAAVESSIDLEARCVISSVTPTADSSTRAT